MLEYVFVVLLVAGLAPRAALALVEGAIDPNVANSPWAGVVSITPSTGGIFSGALIDPYHVLTAAHVVYANKDTPANVTINLNGTGSLSSQIVASQVLVHPSYLVGNTPSDSQFAWHDDIAVIRLSQPAPVGTPSYSLFHGTPGQNGAPRTITMVAYGGYSDGNSASLLQGASATVKRVGRNRVDLLYADDEGSGKAEVFVFDFDGPTASTNVIPPNIGDNLTLGDNIEAGYAGGDSGSPVFVDDNGVWKLAGVGAFNGDPAAIPGNALQFGAIGGGMLVAPHADWITQQTALPVPEPEAYAMMLAGLAILSLTLRARRRP